jgi:hypothetical protein
MLTVEHQLQVCHTDCSDDEMGLFGGLQKIPRRVMPVDRFDQDRDSRDRRLSGGIGQVRHVHSPGVSPAGETGHDMDHLSLDPGGLGKGLIDGGAGLGLAAGQCGRSMLAEYAAQVLIPSIFSPLPRSARAVSSAGVS